MLRKITERLYKPNASGLQFQLYPVSLETPSCRIFTIIHQPHMTPVAVQAECT